VKSVGFNLVSENPDVSDKFVRRRVAAAAAAGGVFHPVRCGQAELLPACHARSIYDLVRVKMIKIYIVRRSQACQSDELVLFSTEPNVSDEIAFLFASLFYAL
jgi:hypothetical protein